MRDKTSIKVEEGKMVTIEAEYGKVIEDVAITGDFFLHPPEARKKLEQRVEGLDKNVTEEEIVQKLEDVDAELTGFDRRDIAKGLKDLTDPEFRIINEGRYSESVHQAIDQVLVKKLDEGKIKPTLRFWHRKNKGIPIGRFQAYEDEVQHDYIEEKDIEVVRRITGGGAMYAEPGDVITYSMYLPKKMVPDDIEESYKELDRWAIEALRDIGLEVDHQPLNDIVHKDGKIGGAAQLRKKGAVLHHTMLSYNLDTENMLKALKIGEEKVSDKAIESAEKRVAVMADYIDHKREEVIEKLIQSFKERYGGEESSLTEEELEEAEKIAQEKFSDENWTRKL